MQESKSDLDQYRLPTLAKEVLTQASWGDKERPARLVWRPKRFDAGGRQACIKPPSVLAHMSTRALTEHSHTTSRTAHAERILDQLTHAAGVRPLQLGYSQSEVGCQAVNPAEAPSADVVASTVRLGQAEALVASLSKRLAAVETHLRVCCNTNVLSVVAPYSGI